MFKFYLVKNYGEYSIIPTHNDFCYMYLEELVYGIKQNHDIFVTSTDGFTIGKIEEDSIFSAKYELSNQIYNKIDHRFDNIIKLVYETDTLFCKSVIKELKEIIPEFWY